MTQFHSLAIKNIRRETSDCVSIAFDIPPHLVNTFLFDAGQNVTLRTFMNGEEVRRSYSICSSPADHELRVAVKKQAEGKFSTHANGLLKAGDRIDVLPPTGRFTTKPDASRTLNYLAFAAGSGITPVISIIKTVLATEPKSTFTLIYGNRDRNHIIFREQLEALKNRYIDRFILHHLLSREQTDAPVHHGRIDEQKCESISRFIAPVENMDHIFLCGPEQMIFTVRDWLTRKGVANDKIHFELFTVPGEQRKMSIDNATTTDERTSQVTVKLDGIRFSFDLAYEGISVLEGALNKGADLPYSCKGGVCATCRAKLVKGEVVMDTNYALEKEELEAGYILTCQSHPRTEVVEIDFDTR